jgi:hypothetical protein
MKERRVQVSVFLEVSVLAAAKQRAGEMKVSTSAAIAEAAKESLLSTYRNEREQEILKAVERNFHAMRRLEKRLWLEITVLKEMVGLGMCSFFNHMAAVPEAQKVAALASGKQRFNRYLDILAKNLRAGASIMGDVPLPEAYDSTASSAPSAKDTAGGTAAHHSKEPAPVDDLGSAASRGVVGQVASQSMPQNGPSSRSNWGLFGPSEGR